MTKIETIIKELDHLDELEMELLIKAIEKKSNQKERIASIFNKYKGIGKGIWSDDAQNYVNQLREDR